MYVPSQVSSLRLETINEMEECKESYEIESEMDECISKSQVNDIYLSEQYSFSNRSLERI